MLKVSENPPLLSPGCETLVQLDGRWWIAHTKARSEKALAWDLLKRRIGYFLPLAQRVYFSGGKKRRVLLPLFPSYLFFCGSVDDRYAAMRTDRVARTLEVPDQAGLVAELAAVERVLRQATLEPYPCFPAGRRCRIVAGAFAGVEGIVVRQQSSTRIVLKVSAIAIGASMEIDSDLLEPVDAARTTGALDPGAQRAGGDGRRAFDQARPSAPGTGA